MENKTLVVYYSRPGKNYVDGDIVDLKVGNTQVVAEKIQRIVHSDIFRIVPEPTYPADYAECTNVAKMEKNANARPKYKGDVEKFGDYDVIFLGYPNWWGTMPMVVFTFLESHDFAGKTIIPFCTNEGSGMGSSESDLRRLCPKATLVKGLSIKGSTVNDAATDNTLSDWIKRFKP